MEGVLLSLPSPLQSLAMLKDGFRTDRGSHSDLWSSSSSLESSGFPLPKQYLDVSSQTDISGGVSTQHMPPGPERQSTLPVTRPRSWPGPSESGCCPSLPECLLLQPSWPPADMR